LSKPLCRSSDPINDTSIGSRSRYDKETAFQGGIYAAAKRTSKNVMNDQVYPRPLSRQGGR
ncbi:MAG: hypothetical protein JXX29_19200, partial [Deltaproteobacteria bacterium]|nr:hypothetical protein [Deltaproteobacteria bacterium]MBN2673815.1 hypothetical protein [Deltaproteobacteria bacterium]